MKRSPHAGTAPSNVLCREWGGGGTEQRSCCWYQLFFFCFIPALGLTPAFVVLHLGQCSMDVVAGA